jgi:hypothetical protein
MKLFTLFRPAPLAACAVLLGACASTPPAAPVFDPQSDARAQAAQFIGNNGKTKNLAEVRKVAVTSCNVLFAESAAAHSGTGGGLFSEVGNARRAESKVSVIYTLEGAGDADMQRFANEVCADAERRMQAAGYEIVPTAELVADASFQALMASGKSSPFKYKNGNSTYKVFAPDGYTVYDPRYLGTVGGLGQAFKAAGGNSIEHHHGLVMDRFQASAVAINVMIDFAELQGDGNASPYSLASKNTAEVQHGVNLGVTGQVEFRPLNKLDCWNRFGKRECMLKAGQSPVFSSSNPVTTREVFYKAVVNTTTTGDKVAAGVTKALSVMAALGGVGGVSSQDTTRYSVEVEPEQFTKVSRDGVNGFLDMVFVSARAI